MLFLCKNLSIKKQRETDFFKIEGGNNMEFFNQAIDVLSMLVVAIGAGLGIWGVVNLLEGYGNDNPGANAQST